MRTDSRRFEVDRSHGEAGVHEGDDARIHPVAELIELVAEDRGQVDAPVRDPGVGDLSAPAEVHLLDDCTRVGEGVGRLADRLIHLWRDRVAAEVDVEREPHALD